MDAERIKEMLVEPSTWRGVGGLLVALGAGNAGTINAVVAAGIALTSMVEVIRRESK